jgi:hypothetical protein
MQQTAVVCTTIEDLATGILCASLQIASANFTCPGLVVPWLRPVRVSPCEIQACGVQSGTVTVSLQALLFFLSVSFNQCCILGCILILLLAEGHVGEGWEPSDKAMLLGEHWAEMYTESCVTLQLHLCRYRQVICFGETESCVSNDQAFCFTVMNRPYKQRGLEGYMVQIQIAFHAFCIPVMKDLQYMPLRRPDLRAELVWTCWPSLATSMS